MGIVTSKEGTETGDYIIILTDRKGKVMFSQVFFCSQSAHGYWFTACPCYGAVGTQASYRNTVLFKQYVWNTQDLTSIQSSSADEFVKCCRTDER